MRIFRDPSISRKRMVIVMVTSSLALLFLVLQWVAPARAQEPPRDLTELSVEELMKVDIDTVYGASKSLQKVTEAPASVSIVTADEIQKYGYRTLADILRSVRGFYVTYDRNYSYLGERGFSRSRDYNSRILVLVDGHRLNDNVYDGALIGTEFPMDVDLIQRVEVIRGPSSSLYGTSAFFGVVNIITKRGGDAEGATASVEGASFGTYKGRFSYGNRLGNGAEMLFSGSFYDSRGQRSLHFSEFDSPATNNGIAQNADYDQYHSFFANLSYRDFSLQALYGSRTKGIPTASFGTVFDDPRNLTLDARSYLKLGYEHTFGNQWDVRVNLSYDWYYYTGTYIYDYAGTGVPPFVENKDFTHGDWWGAEVTVSKRLLEKHRVTLGSEFRDNLRQDQANLDVQPFLSYLDDRRSSKTWGLYAQDEFVIRHDLLLNAGLRLDDYGTFGTTVNPRLGLIYNPRPQTAIKLLYGQAFRVPSAFELFYHTSTATQFNPPLGPETIKTTELVLEQYFGAHLRLTTSGFYNRIGGLIVQTTDEAGRSLFTNLESVRGKGLEFELAGKWPNGFEGRIAYTVQGSTSQESHDVLTNSPRDLIKTNFIIPLAAKKVFAGLEGQYTSKRRTVSGTDVGGFFVMNLTLFGQKLAKGLDVSASLYNVLDKRYADPAAEEHREFSIPQDGRNLRLKLTYRF